MSSKVKIKITNGSLAGTKFGIEDRMNCFIGRDKECTICIPKEADPRVSRHHCIMEIDPPVVGIQDLGSKNGTYINHNKLEYSPEGDLTFLKDGDEVRIGKTVISIKIQGNDAVQKKIRCKKCGGVVDDNNQCPDCAGELTLVKAKSETFIMNKSDKNILNIEGHNLVGLLGKGGMGTVFLAEETDTRKQVALKVFLPRTETTQEMIDKFLREAETTALLKHENIIEVRKINYTDDAFYFSMEYCEKGDLWDYIENREAIDIKEAVNFTFQILDGLEYAHKAIVPNVKLADGDTRSSQGIVHRDIKPGNIYLQEIDGKLTAKIADFGISKAFDLAGLSGFTRTGEAAGSPMFICKKHLFDYKYAQPEVDVWATAATLYYMITKEFPRDERDDGNAIKMILGNEVVPIKERNLGIPNPLAELIDLALKDDGELHFRNALAEVAVICEM